MVECIDEVKDTFNINISTCYNIKKWKHSQYHEISTKHENKKNNHGDLSENLDS